MTLFDFAIVGAQKGGTTFLGRCLMPHPEIFLPEQDIDYFERDDYDPSDLTEVNEPLRNGMPGTRRGIKRPDYLSSGHCAERLYQAAPELRLIVVLRDPIKRAVSAYFHFMRDGLLPVVEPNDGFQKLLAGKISAKFPRAGQILEYGLYHNHLQNYLKFFPRENILILLNEDLQANRDQELLKVYEFLNIALDSEHSIEVKTANAGVYSLRRIQIHNSLSPIFYNYNGARRRVEHRHSLTRLLQGVFNRLDRKFLATVFPERDNQIDESIHARLIDYYRDDVIALEALLGRELNWLRWKG